LIQVTDLFVHADRSILPPIPAWEKVNMIKQLHLLTSSQILRFFWGLVEYIQQFIFNCSAWT